GGVILPLPIHRNRNQKAQDLYGYGAFLFRTYVKGHLKKRSFGARGPRAVDSARRSRWRCAPNLTRPLRGGRPAERSDGSIFCYRTGAVASIAAVRFDLLEARHEGIAVTMPASRSPDGLHASLADAESLGWF